MKNRKGKRSQHTYVIGWTECRRFPKTKLNVYQKTTTTKCYIVRLAATQHTDV